MTDTKDLDGLYGLPLPEFTPARDRLAAQLREDGDREAAAEVKKLRRPTLSAWVINQLVRLHRPEVKDVLAVGEEVRAAQRKAPSAGALREITVRRRRVIDRTLDLAEGLLAKAGHATGRSTLDAVADTMMAATVDEEAAEAVRVGHLARELAAPSGFETIADFPISAKVVSKPERQARARLQRAKDQVRDAEKEAKEADREARRLEQLEEQTRRDAERARRRANRAAERARELMQKAKESSRPKR
jgi:hypothetical protein